MSPQERKHMQIIDDLILNASDENLKKIQELDLATQLDGEYFYDRFIESKNNPITTSTKKLNKNS